MQYKCQECNDTGGRDKIGAYFDCNACDTAATRRDLNDFVKSLTQRSTYPTHPEDVALAIHQRALAMAPKQEALKGDAQKNPQANTWPAEIYLQAGDIDVKSHLSYDAAMRHEVTWAAESIDWNDVRYIRADLAAPAAANGALPELPKPETMIVESDIGHRAYTADQMRAYGQACAAAGPDAALIELIQKHWNGAYFQGVTKAEAREINEVLALSGAKGN